MRYRPRRADVLCLGGLLAGIALSYALLPVTPELLGRAPVLLEALTGSTASMVAAGAFARVGRISLAVALCAPLAGVLLYDVFYWWAGRRYGERWLLSYAARARRGPRAAMRGQRLVARWGVWVLVLQNYLPVPNAVLQAGTGMSGMPLWLFLLADAAGSMLWQGLIVGLGYAVGRPAVNVVHQISHYSLWITLGLVALLIAYVVLLQSRRAGMLRAARVPDEGPRPEVAAVPVD